MSRSKSLLFFTVFSMFLLSGVSIHAQDQSGTAVPQSTPGDYLILFQEWVSVPDRASAVDHAGAVLRFNYGIVRGAAVHIPNERALTVLQGDPRVATVIPDRKVHAHVVSTARGNSGGSSSAQVIPDGVVRIGASPGSSSRTGKGIGVAAVDTGIDFNHKDLQPVSPACFSAYSSCQDDNGHGTHVAGIIAARNNTVDVVGVAPEAISYAVKVLNQTGSGSDSTVIGGLDWIYQSANSVTPPIRVVNISLGRPGTLDDNPLLRQAIQKIVNEMGVSIIASAGNDPGLEVSQQVPATYPEVMAIASTSAKNGSNKCKFYNDYIKTDTASFFTTDGRFDPLSKIGVTVSAPGETQENISAGCFAQSVGILSTKLGGGITRMSGTSMAAPHVSGVVARILEPVLETGGQISPEEIRVSIRYAADRIFTAPLDSPTSGYTYDGEREGIVVAP